MSDPAPARPSADRNLLFGILALQMDFISRDALVAAMHAWVLAKAKPLGQILLEQQALTAERHGLLSALVKEHLKLHGDHPEKSLAAVSSVGPVRQELEQIADAEVQASLAHVRAARDTDIDPNATRAPSAGTPTSSGLRFRILRPHARGGLGQVFVAHDTELHREVALKEIQDRLADYPDSRARFLLEAEITGGLEHPGVVPVYGLGCYPDGRPFYAMRFIKGDSLKDAIQRFHQAEGPRRNSSERALALRDLLGRFVDICNAIAYAHSRGVLHRDIKPGNVMLGQYGETLVVDWGLAKVIGRPEGDGDSAEGTLRPASAGDSAPTQVGSAVGTPAYMSPEQAAGRLDLLGPTSDVYGLGATFYHLLTGQAPFKGADQGDILQKVQRGEFLAPRQVKREVPAALEAVCLKAMALRPEVRYPTVRALADDVKKWLADEPVSAWREPRRLRAGRWARRHQPLLAAVAAGVLVAVLAGGAGGWWAQRHWAERRAELARQEGAMRQDVASALAQAVRFRQGGHFGGAHELLKQAQRRLGAGGPTDLRAQVDQALADTTLAQRLDAARQWASTFVDGEPDILGARQEYGATWREAGLGGEGEDAAVVGARVRSSAVRTEVVAALDFWAGLAEDGPQRAWLLAVARTADPDSLRDRLRDPALWRDKAALVRLAGEVRVAELSPQLATILAEALQANQGDAVPLLRQVQARYPDDFWLNFESGRALYAAKKWDEALGYYRAALALRPSAFGARAGLCLLLEAKGKVAEAFSYIEQAVRIDPKNALARLALGNALKAQGKVAEAVGQWEEAIRIDPKFAPAHVNLGAALYGQGKLAEAVVHFQQALRLRPEDAKLHVGLGLILDAQGKVAEAVNHYREAIHLDAKFALAHVNLGNALKAQGKVAEAIGHWEQALRTDPKDARTHYNLGNALSDQGKLAEAVAHYREAIHLDPKLALAHYDLGVTLKAQGKVAEAVGRWEDALRIDPKFAPAHVHLGNALQAQGRVAAAVGHYREAIRLDPMSAHAHNGLGAALKAQGKLAEAVAHWEQALRIDPEFAPAHNNLGLALKARGQVAEAVAHYREAIRVDPSFALAHYNLGSALRGQGKLAEAVVHFEQALRIDPAYAPTHIGLGNALYEQGKLPEAVAHYGQATRIDPSSALAHYNLGNALSDQGKLAEAVVHYGRALRIDPTYAPAHGNLGEVLFQQGQFAKARQATRRCLHLLPANHPTRELLAEHLRQCELLLVLDKKFDSVLKGNARPAGADEQWGFGMLCKIKMKHAAAARFYAAAFVAQPKLADDPRADHRYNAACAAALAAAGQGTDAARPDDKERARLRRQALDWLRADLALRGKQTVGGTPQAQTMVQHKLRHWQQDTDLAGVRDAAALAKLPEAERADWRTLWADVAEMLKKAEAGGKK